MHRSRSWQWRIPTTSCQWVSPDTTLVSIVAADAASRDGSLNITVLRQSIQRTCDRRMDGQTRDDSIPRASIASCGKNRQTNMEIRGLFRPSHWTSIRTNDIIIFCFFRVRCNIYISRLCYDVSVRLSARLSVTEMHWHIIAYLGLRQIFICGPILLKLGHVMPVDPRGHP